MAKLTRSDVHKKELIFVMSSYGNCESNMSEGLNDCRAGWYPDYSCRTFRRTSPPNDKVELFYSVASFSGIE